jgi:dTDP-glucose 4,6-dehydratase
MSNKYNDKFFVVIDKKDYCSNVENVTKQENVEIVIGDIRNHELILYICNKFNIDTVVHFAAQSHVDNSFFNSIEFTENNVLGTHKLLETIKIYNDQSNKIEKFIHVSTDEVYGETIDNCPRNENSILDPTNPYAASKAAAEFFVKSYYYSYQFPIIITRGNNVYGINQYPEKVIPKFICNLLNGKKLQIQGDGSCRRNFIYVEDVCKAFEVIMLKGKIGEIYNIKSDDKNEYTVLELAKKLIKIYYNDENYEKYIEHIEDRKFNDKRYLISSDKLIELGWEPVSLNFEQNIEYLISWYKNYKYRYGL